MRSKAASTTALLLASAALALHGQTPARPKWASFDSVSIGDPVDIVFARGGNCKPAYRPDLESNRVIAKSGRFELTPYLLLQSLPTELYAGALPHSMHDSAAVRLAMQSATVCEMWVMGGRASVLALAFERTIDVINIRFAGRGITNPMPSDSVRALLRATWGRGSGDDILREWPGARYHSYLVTQRNPTTKEELGLRGVLVDMRACNAFERALHRARGSGPPATCG